MKRPTRLAILFNGAALLVVLASGAAVLRSVFMPDEVAPCSTRYSQGTQLSLERSRGELLTAADLQARFGGDDWGLLDNARVVALKGDPVKPAIEVRLAKVPGEASTGRLSVRHGLHVDAEGHAPDLVGLPHLLGVVAVRLRFRQGWAPAESVDDCAIADCGVQPAVPQRLERDRRLGGSRADCRDGPTPARWPVTAASMCCGADNGLRSSRRLCSTRPARRMA